MIEAMGGADFGSPARLQALAAIRMGLAAIVLTLLFVTFEPFQTVYTGDAASGSVVNQLGYGLLALSAIVVHLTITPRAVLGSLFRPAWLIMVLWLLQSSFHSPWPDASLRAVLFSLAAMTAMTAALCLPPDATSFRMVLTVAALVVLGLCYFGVVALPSLAIHDASGPEAQHAGLWRGIYSHKNIAGPVMATLFFAGLYLLRCRAFLAGGVIAVLSVVFVVHTGSKTTAILLPAVAALVIFARSMGGRFVPIVILSMALAGTALLTLGTVLIPALYDGLQWLLPGTTFTGRLDLWRFALGVVGDRGWTGMGFESFWTTPVVSRAEIGMELSWDPRGIVNAHNGYLDLVIALGWPGLAIAVVLLAVLPFADFVRAGADREEVRLADFFLMVLAFTLLNAFFESFLFARGSPVWMATWMAIVGLRLLAARPAATIQTRLT